MDVSRALMIRRALVFNQQGTMCLSGSSDHTIRLWDLGQQRCVQTFAVHTDSVWCLHADATFSTVISGGRDRNIYRWACAHGSTCSGAPVTPPAPYSYAERPSKPVFQ